MNTSLGNKLFTVNLTCFVLSPRQPFLVKKMKQGGGVGLTPKHRVVSFLTMKDWKQYQFKRHKHIYQFCLPNFRVRITTSKRTQHEVN